LNKRTSINSIPTIHKEKEMADFRKWLYAFAAVALLAGLTVPASAQSSQMQCAGSANNPLIRAEEYTAMAGDIFIRCQGGIPTAIGTSIPKATITIFVTNTAITSKLTQTSDSPSWNEALLIMDGAGEAVGGAGTGTPLLNCGSAQAPFQTAPANETCNITSAFGDGTGDYSGATLGEEQAARPNVFQGRQVDGSFGQAIQFIGVPIDPPGVNTGFGVQPTRTMRITNLRVNAVALNVYNLGNSFSLTTINTTVSFNGTNFGGNQIVNVQNGTVRIGLVVTAGSSDDNNDSGIGSATFLQCNARAGSTTNGVVLSEGFPTAFKVKNFAGIIANGAFSAGDQFYHWTGGTALGTAAGSVADVNQNVPSAFYNTESGIMFDGALSDPVPNPPAGTGSNFVAPGGTPFNGVTGISSAGEVSQGTRFVIHFTGMPIGSNPSVLTAVELETGNAADDVDTGALRLVCGTDSHGQGGTAASCATTGIGGTSPIILDANQNGFVVYEVAFADPNALEHAVVNVFVNPTININANPPVGGTPQVGVTGTATAGFAPFYSTSTSGVGAAQKLTSSFPIPRFVDNPLPTTPISLYTYGKCACDMLFPGWLVIRPSTPAS